ncbi:YcxB family protein [Ottowia thiooxydans]|uniref:YcxB-like C-terminal domain-containing protein n=1 Tax=Ottowia thiooxydans TaxID=219182 RepID=A0ABV2Q372_9BURK
MSEPMQARFRLSERDYVKAGALYARPTRRVWIFLVLMLALVLVCLLLGSSRLRFAALGGMLGGLLVGLAIHFVISPWLLKRHYRRYKAIQEEQVVSLHDDYVRYSSPDGESRLAWNKVLKWRHNADYVLVYPMPRLYYVVPTAVAAQGFDVDRLKAVLNQKVGAAK